MSHFCEISVEEPLCYDDDDMEDELKQFKSNIVNSAIRQSSFHDLSHSSTTIIQPDFHKQNVFNVNNHNKKENNELVKEGKNEDYLLVDYKISDLTTKRSRQRLMKSMSLMPLISHLDSLGFNKTNNQSEQFYLQKEFDSYTLDSFKSAREYTDEKDLHNENENRQNKVELESQFNVATTSVTTSSSASTRSTSQIKENESNFVEEFFSFQKQPSDIHDSINSTDEDVNSSMSISAVSDYKEEGGGSDSSNQKLFEDCEKNVAELNVIESKSILLIDEESNANVNHVVALSQSSASHQENSYDCGTKEIESIGYSTALEQNLELKEEENDISLFYSTNISESKEVLPISSHELNLSTDETLSSTHSIEQSLLSGKEIADSTFLLGFNENVDKNQTNTFTTTMVTKQESEFNNKKSNENNIETTSINNNILLRLTEPIHIEETIESQQTTYSSLLITKEEFNNSLQSIQHKINEEIKLSILEKFIFDENEKKQDHHHHQEESQTTTISSQSNSQFSSSSSPPPPPSSSPSSSEQKSFEDIESEWVFHTDDPQIVEQENLIENKKQEMETNSIEIMSNFDGKINVKNESEVTCTTSTPNLTNKTNKTLHSAHDCAFCAFDTNDIAGGCLAINQQKDEEEEEEDEENCDVDDGRITTSDSEELSTFCTALDQSIASDSQTSSSKLTLVDFDFDGLKSQNVIAINQAKEEEEEEEDSQSFLSSSDENDVSSITESFTSVTSTLLISDLKDTIDDIQIITTTTTMVIADKIDNVDDKEMTHQEIEQELIEITEVNYYSEKSEETSEIFDKIETMTNAIQTNGEEDEEGGGRGSEEVVTSSEYCQEWTNAHSTTTSHHVQGDCSNVDFPSNFVTRSFKIQKANNETNSSLLIYHECENSDDELDSIDSFYSCQSGDFVESENEIKVENPNEIMDDVVVDLSINDVSSSSKSLSLNQSCSLQTDSVGNISCGELFETIPFLLPRKSNFSPDDFSLSLTNELTTPSTGSLPGESATETNSSGISGTTDETTATTNGTTTTATTTTTEDNNQSIGEMFEEAEISEETVSTIKSRLNSLLLKEKWLNNCHNWLLTYNFMQTPTNCQFDLRLIENLVNLCFKNICQLKLFLTTNCYEFQEEETNLVNNLLTKWNEIQNNLVNSLQEWSNQLLCLYQRLKQIEESLFVNYDEIVTLTETTTNENGIEIVECWWHRFTLEEYVSYLETTESRLNSFETSMKSIVCELKKYGEKEKSIEFKWNVNNWLPDCLVLNDKIRQLSLRVNARLREYTDRCDQYHEIVDLLKQCENDVEHERLTLRQRHRIHEQNESMLLSKWHDIRKSKFILEMVVLRLKRTQAALERIQYFLNPSIHSQLQERITFIMDNVNSFQKELQMELDGPKKISQQKSKDCQSKEEMKNSWQNRCKCFQTLICRTWPIHLAILVVFGFLFYIRQCPDRTENISIEFVAPSGTPH